jgi:hypothetical protein
MPARSPVRRLSAALTLAPLLLFAAAMPATAAAATSAPGDNGDVKVHAVGTSFLDEANQPHVCAFYLDAFNFDTVQQVSWSIDQQPPTGHAHASGGTLVLANGSGHTSTMTLPAGHYKLTWHFNGEKGAAKFKVFWSDCAGVASPPPGSTVISSTGTVIGKVNGHGKIVSLARTGIDVPTSLAAAGGLAALGLCVIHRGPRRLRRHRAA